MGKMKGMLKDSLIEDLELQDNHVDYDFWMQCRKEELLEREGKPTIKLKRKGKHVRRKKSNKI